MVKKMTEEQKEEYLRKSLLNTYWTTNKPEVLSIQKVPGKTNSVAYNLANNTRTNYWQGTQEKSVLFITNNNSYSVAHACAQNILFWATEDKDVLNLKTRTGVTVYHLIAEKQMQIERRSVLNNMKPVLKISREEEDRFLNWWKVLTKEELILPDRYGRTVAEMLIISGVIDFVTSDMDILLLPFGNVSAFPEKKLFQLLSEQGKLSKELLMVCNMCNSA